MTWSHIDLSCRLRLCGSVEAAMVHPRVEVDVWGPGWEGWDDTLSLSANLEGRILPYGKSQGQAVGCGYYDIMVTFSQHPNDKERQWFDSPGCGTVHWHQYGDCHADECLGQTFANTGNVSITDGLTDLHLDVAQISQWPCRLRHPSMHSS